MQTRFRGGNLYESKAKPVATVEFEVGLRNVPRLMGGMNLAEAGAKVGFTIDAKWATPIAAEGGNGIDILLDSLLKPQMIVPTP